MKTRKTGILITPSLEEVKLAAAKIGLPDREAQKFFYHYASIGWMVGTHRMVCFASALSGWKLRWQENGGGASSRAKSIVERDAEKLCREINNDYPDPQ